MFACYDIKGIQQFIFSVPRLKCMIGASGIIAKFDEDSKTLGESFGAEWIFSGGGRGAFFCSTESVDPLAKALVEAAHDDKVALDLRIGADERFSQAIHHADQFFPYCPDSLEGEPCEMSGLWPVAPGTGKGKNKDVHPIVWHRARLAHRDRLGNGLLHKLRKGLDRLFEQRGEMDVAKILRQIFADYEPAFFKNVTPDPEDDEQDQRIAKKGRNSLGGRNRWAVIAMDGNDMGRQFAKLEQRQKQENWPEPQMWQWLRTMSNRLKTCTEDSFLFALGKAIAAWAKMVKGSISDCTLETEGGKPTLILPFRPLILGGDDVTMLCHCGCAMQFVQDMAAAFSQASRQAAQEADQPLWPATNGQLTISGGVLFTKVTFPLHMAIPYAESLLASAKGRYRADPASTQPTRAAVDWESITDTLVDTPAARRHRELRFFDDELGATVQLTRRPYLLDKGESNEPDLPRLLQMADRLAGRKKKSEEVPPSVRAKILPALKRSWSQRIAFYASIAKRHSMLKDQLWEEEGKLGGGWYEDPQTKERQTGLPDALLLLEEAHRTEQITVAD